MDAAHEAYLSRYRTMIRIRQCEECLIAPILGGEIQCPVHLCSGQEAVAAGVCESLVDADDVFGNHRSHGHFIAKGGKIYDLLAEVFCRENGCSAGRGGSMHLIDPEVGFLGAAPIVGGTISLALGAALAHQIRGDGGVAVSFFGDGAAGEGVLYEALNFAAIRKLPIIFVCENNLYSTHMPIREIRKIPTIYQTAETFGVASQAIDGNDVDLVADVIRKVVARCREGEGPAFIECNTYRLRGHVGPDDNIQGTHTDIRSPDEIEEWKRRDPIVTYRNRLQDEYGIEASVLDSIDAAALNEVNEALVRAYASKRPALEDHHNAVFK